MLGAYMEQHALCAVILVVMTVHAMVVFVVVFVIVFVDSLHVKALQVALIQSHLAVQLIRRLNQSVRQVTVNVLLCHTDFVRRKLYPFALALGVECHVKVFSAGSSEHLFPFERVELQHTVLAGSGLHLVSCTLDAAHIFVACRLYLHIKRRNVGRHYNVAVVGVYFSGFVHACGLRWHHCRRFASVEHDHAAHHKASGHTFIYMVYIHCVLLKACQVIHQFTCDWFCLGLTTWSGSLFSV